MFDRIQSISFPSLIKSIQYPYCVEERQCVWPPLQTTSSCLCLPSWSPREGNWRETGVTGAFDQIYTCICTHTHIYTYIHIHTYIYIHAYIHIHIHFGFWDVGLAPGLFSYPCRGNVECVFQLLVVGFQWCWLLVISSQLLVVGFQLLVVSYQLLEFLFQLDWLLVISCQQWWNVRVRLEEVEEDSLLSSSHINQCTCQESQFSIHLQYSVTVYFSQVLLTHSVTNIIINISSNVINNIIVNVIDNISSNVIQLHYTTKINKSDK